MVSSTPPEESEFENAVRDACAHVLDDPLKSDVVSVADIEDVERVADLADVDDSAIRTKIGTVLTNAEYAEKVARNKYRIDQSE